jgi:hypothetical protein
MAELEQKHHHFIASEKNKNVRIGLVLGFLVSLGLMVGAVYSSAAGHDVIAGLFLASGAIGMVSTFVNAGWRIGIATDNSSEHHEPDINAKKQISSSKTRSKKRNR